MELAIDEDMTTTKDIVDDLMNVLETGELSADGALDKVKSSLTFSEAGVLTNEDNGILIRLHDGSEFQITVVQSKAPKANLIYMDTPRLIRWCDGRRGGR